MESSKSAGPLPLPPGTQVTAASGRGLVLHSPEAVPAGAILEFELLLGARPLQVMARVVEARAQSGGQTLQTEFVAMAQVDRDSLMDFLQAVGPQALRVRRPQP